MQQGHYSHEAEQCRAQARAFAGKPEERLLLKIAVVFDDLAGSRKRRARGVSEGWTGA